MKKILLDTNAYAAFKRNQPDIIDVIRHADVIGLNPIVIAELLSGFALGSKEKQNREEFRTFLSSSRIKIYPITDETAAFYAKIYPGLRKKGTPIPTNDIWIAASALEHGCAICTLDGDFQNINGLMTGASLAEFIP